MPVGFLKTNRGYDRGKPGGGGGRALGERGMYKDQKHDPTLQHIVQFKDLTMKFCNTEERVDH